jgi:hypothetical protein
VPLLDGRSHDLDAGDRAVGSRLRTIRATLVATPRHPRARSAVRGSRCRQAVDHQPRAVPCSLILRLVRRRPAIRARWGAFIDDVQMLVALPVKAGAAAFGVGGPAAQTTRRRRVERTVPRRQAIRGRVGARSACLQPSANRREPWSDAAPVRSGARTRGTVNVGVPRKGQAIVDCC